MRMAFLMRKKNKMKWNYSAKHRVWQVGTMDSLVCWLHKRENPVAEKVELARTTATAAAKAAATAAAAAAAPTLPFLFFIFYFFQTKRSKRAHLFRSLCSRETSALLAPPLPLLLVLMVPFLFFFFIHFWLSVSVAKRAETAQTAHFAIEYTIKSNYVSYTNAAGGIASE